jgi:hypothetical protein
MNCTQKRAPSATPSCAPMRFAPTVAAVAFALSVCLPFAAEARRPFILPYETVLTRPGWVSFDGAVSNDLFYFTGQSLPLDTLQVVGPDGQPVQVTNANTSRSRSSFDVQLQKLGTYKLAIVTTSLNGQYETPAGERRRWRGTLDQLSEIPADAKNVRITEQLQRTEAFVTAGKPNDAALKTTGAGLEMVPVTHPNDLAAGEPMTFRFVLDGKPAANVEVAVIAGGTRWRDRLNEMTYTTDKDGRVTMTWDVPGMYSLQAAVEDNKPSMKQANTRRATYSATLEVLPP